MMTQDTDWMVKGDFLEGCTSPPVCPGYWLSPFPKDLHEGKSQCEGVMSFHITEGYYGEINLGRLNVCYAFNTPTGFPEVLSPFYCILFIDDKADDRQTKALEEIYRTCWESFGEVLKVKRSGITFTKELIEGGPAARHTVEIKGAYHFKSEPLLTTEDKPMYIISITGGIIYIGQSEINQFTDTDLPRTWNRPGMSATYFDFTVTPQKISWMPEAVSTK